MKRLLAGLLVAGLMSGQANAVMQYQPHDPAPVAAHDGGGSNVVPIALVVGAVVTTGLILFRVHKVKQERKALFNVYVLAKGGK